MIRSALAAALLALSAPALPQTWQDGTGMTQEGRGVFDLPTSAAGSAIVPRTGLGVTSIVAKASPGNFYGATILADTAAGVMIVANLAAVPASGTALTAAQVLYCVPVGGGAVGSAGGGGLPDRASVGVTLLFSTSCATFTPVAPGAIHMRARAL